MKTPQEIFDANQVLTLAKAKALVGKRIVTTSPEYRMNRPRSQEFVISGFISEWDDAAQREYPKSEKSNFDNYQQYWASFMKPEQIDSYKNSILLLDEKGEFQHRCDLHSGWYSEPTFHGSDADREVYFIQL